MESIFDNFFRFLRSSQNLIEKYRTTAFSIEEKIPLSLEIFPEEDNFDKSDPKNQLFVLEFFLKDLKSKKSYLMEQWIFTFHIDKLPKKNVKIVRTQQELNIVFNSLIKTIINLLMNLPLYKEYLNKNSKYSQQISYDFMLSKKIINKLTEISNFQGWDSEKWSHYYTKFPTNEEFSFYMISQNIAFKFSFQLNYFKNLFSLYKVLDPIKHVVEKNRFRSISEQTSEEINQQKKNFFKNSENSNDEYIQWTSKNSFSFNESLEDNFLKSSCASKSFKQDFIRYLLLLYNEILKLWLIVLRKKIKILKFLLIFKS